MLACGIRVRYFWLIPEGSIAGRRESHAGPWTMASEQSGRDGVFKSGPNTLKYRSCPEYGVPFGFVAGGSGFPNESTDWIVGLAPVVLVTVLMFPLAHPSQ